MQTPKIFLAALLASCFIPAHAQEIPALLQGKWVGNATAVAPDAAQLRALCNGEVHDEAAMSLDIGADSLIYADIGSTTTANHLHFSSHSAAELSGTAQVQVVYEDESSDPPRQGNFSLTLRDEHTLQARADWLNGVVTYFRCPR